MVMVVVSKCFCMIRWLPCWRTAANPCSSRIRQISEPERTRSLPNRHLNLSHENFVVRASGNFGRGGGFEEQCERLDEVDSRFFNRRTFARNIEFRTKSHKTVVLTFDNRGQALRQLHDPSLHRFKWIRMAWDSEYGNRHHPRRQPGHQPL